MFEFADPASVPRNIHRELITMMRQTTRAPTPRPQGLLASARRLARRALRPAKDDLYDLGRWTPMVGR